MDREDRDGQLCHAFLLMLIPPALILVESSVAKDDHDIIPAGLHLLAKADDAVKVAVGIPCDVNHCYTSFTHKRTEFRMLITNESTIPQQILKILNSMKM